MTNNNGITYEAMDLVTTKDWTLDEVRKLLTTRSALNWRDQVKALMKKQREYELGRPWKKKLKQD